MTSLPQRTETKPCVRETTISLVPFRKVICPYAKLTATSEVRIIVELLGVVRGEGFIEARGGAWSACVAGFDGTGVAVRV